MRGGARRGERTEGQAVIEPPVDDLLAVDEAIPQLQQEKPHLAEIAMLRYFAGLSVAEAADALGISEVTAARYWAFARAWLYAELSDPSAVARGENRPPG